MDFLRKLDNISISVFDKLDIHDRNKVMFIEKCYKGKLSYFLDIKEKMGVLYADSNSNEYFGRGSQENPFRYENYDLKDYMNKLDNSIRELKKRFIDLIINYFETKYKFPITKSFENRERLKKMNENPDAKQILEFIFELTKGQSFLDIGIQNIKSEFKDTMTVRNRDLSLKGDTISISNMAYTCSAWNGDPEVNGERLNIILLAISLFEFGSSSNQTGIDLYPSWKVKYDPQSDIVLPMCKKVRSYKIYKNGKVTIKFSSKADSAQFFDFFELNK